MDQIIVLVGMLTSFVVGYLAKKSTNTADKIRKLIPIGNIVIGIITQMLASANSALPPETAPAVAMAGFFGSFGKGLLDTIINGIIQGLLVTGVHSTQKNVREAAKQV